MTGTLIEPRRWPAKRWLVFVSTVFATQLFLIFWLGRPQKHSPLNRGAAPVFELVGEPAQAALALIDPTLFALPHRESFSGHAWLSMPTQDLRPSSLPESPYSMALYQKDLGDEFRDYMATNRANALPVIHRPELQLLQPTLPSPQPLLTRSTLRLAGDLAGRRLVVAPTLRSWPSAEILSNSVVQVLVTADGTPMTANLLSGSGSGSAEADQEAVREARKSRFEPVQVVDPLKPLAGIAWGQMIFEWHTIPLPVTNSPPETSSTK